MTNHQEFERWLSRSAGAALALLLTGAAPVTAQSTQVDARWQAWIGCWTPAGPQPMVGRTGAQPAETGNGMRAVCVVPASGASAVDIATVIDGKVAERTHIDANGEHRPASREGCTGWESATWSAGAREVFLRSDYSCSGGLKHGSSGIIAMAPGGQWLDVQGISTGSYQGVSVTRYRAMTNLSGLPAEVTDALKEHSYWSSAARLAAAGDVTTADVTEASRQVDAPVVATWLVERGQGFKLDAKRLTELADAGVPASVTDVMVGLSYPKVFAVNRSTRETDYRPQDEPRRGYGYGDAMYGYPYGADYYMPYGYSACSPYSYAYSPYGCSMLGYGFAGYGYGGFGYGGGYGGAYGWYPGYGPVIVVRGSGTAAEAPPHGKVVKGRGYSSGGSGSGGATPTPSREPAGGSSSTGSTGSTGSSSSGGSSTGRTAHRIP